MAPTSTLHIVRHAEGYHQLPKEHPNASIRDPALTPDGIEQCKQFCASYPYHDSTDLLCASPLRRAIQTTSYAFAPELERGLKILALSDAQEMTDALSDIGSEVSKLNDEFASILDTSLLSETWFEKTGTNGTEIETLHQRARRLRNLLRARPENTIVLVSHGAFTHYVTEHIDPEGQQTGEYWVNTMWRTYTFDSEDDENARLVETQESLQRHES